MDIRLYISLISFILISANCIDIQTYPISDYILSFNTYHFEWNKQHFITKTSNQHQNTNDITTCTVNIPSLCINYSPNTPGFILSYNNTFKLNFLNDNDWTQISYIHSNDSIALYDDTFISSQTTSNLIDSPPQQYEFYEDEEDEDEEDEDDNDLALDQSPNPNYPGRRLLRRSSSCRAYLYRDRNFRGRISQSFGRGRYRSSSLRRRGYKGGAIRSVKVRGSKCCTAKLYRSDGYRGGRVRFRRGSYSRIRSSKHRIKSLGSMKVYCSSRGRRRRRWRFGRGRRRRRRCPCNQCPCGGGYGDQPKPIPILLGPMTGMLNHYGYSMHPIIPPQMAMMQGMMGNYGMMGGAGMPMMSHPYFGHPMMGSGYGPGMMGMGGMGMGGMGMGMGMHPGMMGMMGAGGRMHGQQGGKTPVVHVYADKGQRRRRRRLMMESDNEYFDGIAFKKCVVIQGAEICVTYWYGQKSVSLDYTEMKGRMLRIGDVDHDEEEEEEGVVVNYVDDGDDEELDEEEEPEFDDDDDEWMMDHEEYQIWRNERVFGLRDKGKMGLDYINILPYMWSEFGCDDDVLSFMNISVCSEQIMDENKNRDIMIELRYNGHNTTMDEGQDEWFDDLRLKVRNQMDWDETYDINMINEENKVRNKKLCRISAMIKVCVEMAENQYLNGDIHEMQMSFEFL